MVVSVLVFGRNGENVNKKERRERERESEGESMREVFDNSVVRLLFNPTSWVSAQDKFSDLIINKN